MKEFDKEKWFSKFHLHYKKGNKNKLYCTKLSNREQIQVGISIDTCRGPFHVY